MKNLFFGAVLATLPCALVAADDLDTKPACQELIALFIELAERSGETVTPAQARAEVMSENPANSDCAAMLALFPKQG